MGMSMKSYLNLLKLCPWARNLRSSSKRGWEYLWEFDFLSKTIGQCAFLGNTSLRACVNTSFTSTVNWLYWVESASELFYRLLVSTRLKSNRRDTGSRKGLFLLVLLSMLLWSQLNCLQNKGFYLKLTMSGLVSVQNTVDTGHEDMIVSWLSPIFTISRQM